MWQKLGILSLISLFAAALLLGQQSGATLLERGRAKKESGDLQTAMEVFETVANEFAASDRKAAANALLELGGIAESLGQLSRARAFYERVRNDFKDQSAEVDLASNRLKTQASGAAGNTSESGVKAKSKVTIRTPYADDIYGFALSPDGKTLVFQATTPDGKRQLWRQTVDPEAKPELIAGSEGAGINARPFFSPDGKFVVYAANQKVWQLALGGGVPKELADAPYFTGGAWRGDSILLSIVRTTNSPLMLFQEGRLAGAPMAAGNYAQPVFIDDRRFIYFARDPRAPGTLQVGSLDGPITGNGLPAAKGGTYTSGFLVYATQPGSAPPAQNTAAQSGVLNAIRFDPKNLVTSGAPIILAEKVGLERRLPGIAAVTASASGSIAYRENAVMDRQMVWMDRNGDLVGTVGTMDSATPSLPRVSPDGRSILFVRQVGASIGSTWALDAANGAIRQLLDASNVALWSSNGDSILFATLRNRNNTASGTLLLERPLTASAGGTQFGPADTAIFPQDWAANGAVLYMTGTSVVGSGSGDLMVLPAPRATPVTVAQTPASERNGRFSSDGRWIAYQSDQTGRNEIYVQPFPGTIDQRQRVSLNGGTSPQWGRKGRELYFMSADNHLMVAAANPTSEKGSLEFNTPKQLFRSPLPQGTEYDTTLDGDRFLILSPAGEPPPIIVLSNWIPER